MRKMITSLGVSDSVHLYPTEQTIGRNDEFIMSEGVTKT